MSKSCLSAAAALPTVFQDGRRGLAVATETSISSRAGAGAEERHRQPGLGQRVGRRLEVTDHLLTTPTVLMVNESAAAPLPSGARRSLGDDMLVLIVSTGRQLFYFFMSILCSLVFYSRVCRLVFISK